MLLTYVDESYRDINDKFNMAAMLCTPEGVATLGSALELIVAKATANRGIPSEGGLHPYEMWQQKPPWDQFTPDEIVEISQYCIDALAQQSKYITRRGVDVPRQRATDIPTCGLRPSSHFSTSWSAWIMLGKSRTIWR